MSLKTIAGQVGVFRGQFVHSIDKKGRTSMPACFRDAIVCDGDARVVLTKAPFDPCLHLYPFRAWVEYEAKISALPSHDPHIVRFRRTYISPALECEVDGAGRVRISQEFREQSQLNGEVLWAGMGRIVELWAKELFEKAIAFDDAAEVQEYRERLRGLI